MEGIRDGINTTSPVIDEIDRRLHEVDEQLGRYQALVDERDRLLRARAALLGKQAVRDRVGGRRITQDDVAEVLEKRPGSRPGEVAEALGVNQPTISAHLYRGKEVRFTSRDGRWYVIGESKPESVRPANPRGWPTTPDELADELGVDGRTVRQWLRDQFPRAPEEKHTEWRLERELVLAARRRWGRED